MVKACLSLFLVTLTVCTVIITVQTSYLLSSVPVLIATEGNATRNLVDTNLNLLRTDAVAILTETNKNLDSQLTELRANLTSSVDNAVRLSDAQLAEINTTLAEQSTALNETLKVATTDLDTNTKTALAQVQVLEDRLLEREPMIYSRYLAITGETMRTLDAWRRMSEEAAKAAPEVVGSVKDISKSAVTVSENVGTITGNVAVLTKPKKWYHYLLQIPGAVKSVF